MRPVRTAKTDVLFVGGDDILDLPTQTLEDGAHASVWWLTPIERELIAAGANIELIAAGANIALIVSSRGHPPVMLTVVDDSPGVGEDAPDILERLEKIRHGGEAHT